MGRTVAWRPAYRKTLPVPATGRGLVQVIRGSTDDPGQLSGILQIHLAPEREDDPVQPVDLQMPVLLQPPDLRKYLRLHVYRNIPCSVCGLEASELLRDGGWRGA